MTLEDAIKEVYYWQYSNTGSFTNLVCLLWQKADPGNKARLFKGFPELCTAMKLWEESDDNGDELFRKAGLLKEQQ